VVATLLQVIKNRWPKLDPPIVKVVSAGIIAAGIYWFIIRVFFQYQLL
jgi:hypothetical protein